MIVNEINNFIVVFKLTSVKMVLIGVPYRDRCICCVKLS